MSKAGLLPGASKRHPEAQSRGGDPTGGQTGPRGGGQQEEGKDLRRLVDPKGSADFQAHAWFLYVSVATEARSVLHRRRRRPRLSLLWLKRQLLLTTLPKKLPQALPDTQ